MTDYRSAEVLEVRRDGQPIGHLTRTAKGCRFDYTPDFLDSSQAAVAYHLPKTPEGIVVEGQLNLPTYFSGLVPEGAMGEAIVRLLRTSRDDLFTVLAATGFDAVGDITVHVQGETPRLPKSVAEARHAVEELLSLRANTPPSALAGVQPKMSIGSITRSARGHGFLAKFPSPGHPGLVENENFCMKCARYAGIRAAKTEVRDGALVVRRFDRLGTSQLHVEDALQLMDRFPNSKYSFEWAEIGDYLMTRGFGRTVVLGMLKLYVYSYLIGNGDLHAKNVSFLRDAKTGLWNLTPAYDLLSTLPYPQYDPSMCLALENEAKGRFTEADFVRFGARFGLPEKSIVSTVRKCAKGVMRLADEPEAVLVLGEAAVETIRGRVNGLTQ